MNSENDADRARLEMAVDSQLQGLSYPATQADLWSTVQNRIRLDGSRRPIMRRLWLLGAFVFGWRALQLLIDLPMPVLHPFVPLAAAVAVLWPVASDLFAIQTFAPELQKRGV